jgi:hypothetical protein
MTIHFYISNAFYSIAHQMVDHKLNFASQLRERVLPLRNKQSCVYISGVLLSPVVISGEPYRSVMAATALQLGVFLQQMKFVNREIFLGNCV